MCDENHKKKRHQQRYSGIKENHPKPTLKINKGTTPHVRPQPRLTLRSVLRQIEHLLNPITGHRRPIVRPNAQKVQIFLVKHGLAVPLNPERHQIHALETYHSQGYQA